MYIYVHSISLTPKFILILSYVFILALLSEDGYTWPKHVKALNIYKLNHTGLCCQLFYNNLLVWRTRINKV
jgi:hypothetical protein